MPADRARPACPAELVADLAALARIGTGSRVLEIGARSSAGYADLLSTCSGVLAMPPAAGAGLLGCLAGLIDTRYRGRIVKRYLSELRIAARAPRRG